MNFKYGSIKLLEYAVVVTILSIILEKVRYNRYPTYRVFFRFIHYVFLVFFVGYTFIFDKRYDYIYFIAIFVMNLSWEINENRCILSDLETIDSKDRSNTYHPYFEVFVGKHTDILVMLQLVFMIYNFYVILSRNSNGYIKLLSIIFAILIAYKLLRSRVRKLNKYLKSKGIL